MTFAHRGWSDAETIAETDKHIEVAFVCVGEIGRRGQQETRSSAKRLNDSCYRQPPKRTRSSPGVALRCGWEIVESKDMGALLMALTSLLGIGV